MPFHTDFTELFISEIQKRQCIWNTGCDEYSDRMQRQNAFIEIAEIFFDDYPTLDEEDQMKKVQELQKKWKGLRDYFSRERHKTPSSTCANGRKKRKTPLLDKLQFLNANKSLSDADFDGPNSEDSQPSSSLIQKAKSSKNTSSMSSSQEKSGFQEIWVQTMEKKREDDPDMSFLLNILSEMKSMTPSENFDFRFEVMKIIKKMKYDKKVTVKYEEDEDD